MAQPEAFFAGATAGRVGCRETRYARTTATAITTGSPICCEVDESMRRFWIWNCWFLFLWQGLPLKISWMTGWQDHKQQFQQQQVQELLEQKVHQLQLQVQQQQQQHQKAQQQQAQQQAQQEAEQQCPVRKCSELCHVIVGVVAVFFWSGFGLWMEHFSGLCHFKRCWKNWGGGQPDSQL